MPSSPPRAAPAQPLYHLGYTLPADLPRLTAVLRAVRFVLLCGTPTRAAALAAAVRPGPHPDLCRTARYTVLRPAPAVLVAAHGIGAPSIDTLLHELHLALRAAAAGPYALLRLGSCGALGLAPGALVVSRRALAPDFAPRLRLPALGDVLDFPARLCPRLSAALLQHAVDACGEHAAVMGDTLCADSFYVAQGRLDGAFAVHDEKTRRDALHRCRDRGVVNFEMESLALAAFATRVGVPAAVLCVAVVDRLQGETPMDTDERLSEYMNVGVQVVAGFVNECLSGERVWER